MSFLTAYKALTLTCVCLQRGKNGGSREVNEVARPSDAVWTGPGGRLWAVPMEESHFGEPDS